MRKQKSSLDQAIIHFDRVLRIISGGALAHKRPSPAQELENAGQEALTSLEKKHSAGLMRINHTGEVCAQALYQGQSLTSRSPKLKEDLLHAQAEEIDHLAWCAERLEALESKPSVLNPFWYAGSLALGALAGLMGDAWNLGFLAETERQVEAHLHEHLECLPQQDHASRAVLAQMKTDEAQHAAMAEDHGARVLPGPVKLMMRLSAGMMKRVVYYR